MAKSSRGAGRRTPRSPGTRSTPTSDRQGTGGFWRLVGNSESINGMPNGVFGIALALAAALVVYPVTRFVRWLVRR